MCPSKPSELWSTSTLLQLCAVLIGWLVSYAIHFKSANFHFGCNSQLISQLMIDLFPTMMTTGWLIFRTLPIINTGKHVTRLTQQYCQTPEKGILISGSKGIKKTALDSVGRVINDKSENAERVVSRKGFENDIIGHFCPIASDQPSCKLVLHTNYKSDQGRDVRKKALWTIIVRHFRKVSPSIFEW